MRYVRRLDGLRGLAVLFVLVQHFPAIERAVWSNQIIGVYKKLGLGYIGVELFFILSGYLITRLLLEAVDRNEQHILVNFYIKRSLRILPVFFLTIAACVLLLPDYNYFFISTFLANYYFSFNPDPHPLRHFWSLAVEEQFYLVWPLLVLLLAGSKSKVGKILLVLIAVAIAIVLIRDILISTEVSRALIHRSVETRMIALCVGGYFAVYGIPTASFVRLMIALLVCVSMVFALQMLSVSGLWPYMKSTKTFGYLGVSICIFLLAAGSQSRLARIFEFRPLVGVGIVSYGLYVYHQPLYYYLGYSHLQMKGKQVSFETALLLVALTILVVLLSWFAIEKPLRANRHRFLRKTPLNQPSEIANKSDS